MYNYYNKVWFCCICSCNIFYIYIVVKNFFISICSIVFLFGMVWLCKLY